MQYVPAKTIVYRDNSQGWFGADYKMNIYRGCCHGCIYCDSRSDCYRVEDFGTVKAKENALQIIRDDLRRKVKPGVVVTGSMSDPYNPQEKEHMLTRHALELINAYGFGAGIATKSPLVTRDSGILLDIMEHSPVIIKMTVTAADDSISRLIEPGVQTSSERFAAIKELSGKGIYCGILMMPILPDITDNAVNIEGIVEMARDSGARFIYPSFGLTMRQGQREYFYHALDEKFPGLREKYALRFGEKYVCSSPKAESLQQRFKALCDGYGILYKMTDIIRSYKMGYEGTQLKFF